MSYGEKRVSEKKPEITTNWHKKFESLSLTAGAERKAEEALKEEQRLKAEMRETAKRAVTLIKADINALIGDEREAIYMYESMVKIYGAYGWRHIFADILTDERKHLEMLRISLKAVEEEMEKYLR